MYSKLLTTWTHLTCFLLTLQLTSSFKYPYQYYSKSDDTSVTTDPLIGVWTVTYTTVSGKYNNSYNINSNGTYIYTEELLETLYEGEWSNDGTNLSSRNQIYSISMNTYLDSKLTARFSSDFNSFEIYEEEGNVYVKQ